MSKSTAALAVAVTFALASLFPLPLPAHWVPTIRALVYVALLASLVVWLLAHYPRMGRLHRRLYERHQNIVWFLVFVAGGLLAVGFYGLLIKSSRETISVFARCRMSGPPSEVPADGSLPMVYLTETDQGPFMFRPPDLNVAPHTRMEWPEHGWMPLPFLECKLTNDLPEPLFSVVLGFSLRFQNMIPDSERPGTFSGGTFGERSTGTLEFARIPAGGDLLIYIVNESPNKFAQVDLLDDSASAIVGATGERRPIRFIRPVGYRPFNLPFKQAMER